MSEMRTQSPIIPDYRQPFRAGLALGLMLGFCASIIVCAATLCLL